MDRLYLFVYQASSYYQAYYVPDLIRFSFCTFYDLTRCLHAPHLIIMQYVSNLNSIILSINIIEKYYHPEKKRYYFSRQIIIDDDIEHFVCRYLGPICFFLLLCAKSNPPYDDIDLKCGKRFLFLEFPRWFFFFKKNDISRDIGYSTFC